MAGVFSGALPAEGHLQLRPGLLWSRGSSPLGLGGGGMETRRCSGSLLAADKARRLGGVRPGVASKAICTQEMAQGCQP